MLTGSKEQNYLSLFQGRTGIVMMRRTNRYQDVLYYGFKFIVLGKSREDFFCASSEGAFLFKAELQEFVLPHRLGACLKGPDARIRQLYHSVS